jgi:ABC-type lipoprotein export system ATPase subunit
VGETAVHALRGVDLDVAGERLTAVMGPSGSGKSTLMHILAGLDEPSSGEVVVAVIDIGGLDDTALTKWRRDHIAISIPIPELVAFTVVAIVAGLGAAIMPARRASRLNVLDALHYE